MKKEFGVTGYLKEGDIIKVGNPLMKDKYSEYRVKKIEGNKAITDFRTFNRKIYWSKRVYEYGKKLSPHYNNSYTVVDISSPDGYFSAVRATIHEMKMLHLLDNFSKYDFDIDLEQGNDPHEVAIFFIKTHNK